MHSFNFDFDEGKQQSYRMIFICKMGIICDIKISGLRCMVFFYFINVYQLILSFSACIQDKDKLIWQFW